VTPILHPLPDDLEIKPDVMTHFYKLDLPFCHQTANISLTDSQKRRHSCDVHQLRDVKLACLLRFSHCSLPDRDGGLKASLAALTNTAGT
jgi:hypothetical protein